MPLLSRREARGRLALRPRAGSAAPGTGRPGQPRACLSCAVRCRLYSCPLQGLSRCEVATVTGVPATTADTHFRSRPARRRRQAAWALRSGAAALLPG